MTMAHLEPEPAETDSLTSLEERIRRTIELVATIRAERDAALEELEAAHKTVAEAKKLREEIEALRTERKHVRVRIEKLLGQMDLLSGQ